MGAIPGIKKTRFYQKKWIVECIAVGPPIITASATAWINFLSPDKISQAWLLVGGVVWLILASITKVVNAYQQDAEEKKKQDYDGLFGALHVLHASVTAHLKFVDKDPRRIRITIHRVIPTEKSGEGSEHLEQLLPYIGGAGGSAGRKFSIYSGVVGRAVREKTPYTFFRVNDDYDGFIRELISNWTYTDETAKKLTSDCKAWMAVPIFGNQKNVVSVVYLDSTDKESFDKQGIQDLVITSCIGVAAYINERYK